MRYPTVTAMVWMVYTLAVSAVYSALVAGRIQNNFFAYVPGGLVAVWIMWTGTVLFRNK